VLADGSSLLDRLANCLRRQGVLLEDQGSGHLESHSGWVETLAGAIEQDSGPDERVILRGGEPAVVLRRAGAGRGGRMSHLAAALILRHHDLFLSGGAELLCGASDGIDGKSKSGGVWFGPRQLTRIGSPGAFLARLKGALNTRNTAAVFEGAGALIPQSQTGTNLQDAVLIRISRKG
jgi:glycerate-2-kinase